MGRGEKARILREHPFFVRALSRLRIGKGKLSRRIILCALALSVLVTGLIWLYSNVNDPSFGWENATVSLVFLLSPISTWILVLWVMVYIRVSSGPAMNIKNDLVSDEVNPVLTAPIDDRTIFLSEVLPYGIWTGRLLGPLLLFTVCMLPAITFCTYVISRDPLLNSDGLVWVIYVIGVMVLINEFVGIFTMGLFGAAVSAGLALKSKGLSTTGAVVGTILAMVVIYFISYYIPALTLLLIPFIPDDDFKWMIIIAAWIVVGRCLFLVALTDWVMRIGVHTLGKARRG